MHMKFIYREHTQINTYIYAPAHKNLYATYYLHIVIKRIGQVREVHPKYLAGMNILSSSLLKYFVIQISKVKWKTCIILRALKINFHTENNFSCGIKCLLFEFPKGKKKNCVKGDLKVFITMTQKMQFFCCKNNRKTLNLQEIAAS